MIRVTQRKLKQAQLDSLSEAKRVEEMAFEPRRGKRVPIKEMRGKTNPLPHTVDEVRPLRQEVSGRQAYAQKIHGIAEFQVNKDFHREEQKAKRRANRKRRLETKRIQRKRKGSK